MDFLDFLYDKGYLFESNEPGVFIRCADTTLEYRTWDAAIRPTQRQTKAPFGLIYARECNQKGAEVLFNRLRKNWNELNYDPEVLILNTSKCNLDCPYCIVGVHEAAEFRLPSLEQIENAFKLFPVKRVVITGGEPLSEKENFSKILEWLIGRVERCDVITNGFAWDDDLWPLFRKCGKEFELWVRLTLSETLTHMKLTEFENKILPKALNCPEVKLNLNFLPNHDGTGLGRFLKRVNELEFPPHITVTPSYLTESKVSGPVEFNIENYLKEMIEVVENEAEYLSKVNIDPGKSLWLLVHDLQLLGCKRRTITISDKGYALCNIFHCEGNIFKGPLEAASFIWERLVRVCRDCEDYPDHCIEAIKSDKCARFTLGCNCCPIVYICALRCPYAFDVEKDVCVGETDLQCLGYPLLRIFADWLMHRKRTWAEIEGEVTPSETGAKSR